MWLIMSVLIAPAATIQWTNTTGGFWSAATNWSPNAVPGAADTVIITNDGIYSVMVNVSPATLSGLVLGGSSGVQTLMSGMGALNVNGAATVRPQGHLNLSGGLTANNGLSLEGMLTWSGGSISAATTITIASNGVLTLTGGSGKLLFGTVTNAGTILSSGSSGLSGSGKLYNLPTGLFDAATGPGFSGTTGSRLVNDGTLRKSGGLPTVTFTATEFTNNGTIDAQIGTITLPTLTWNEGSRFVGAGTNQIQSSGTMNGAFTSENLLLNVPGAGLRGTGTLHGVMGWSNGLISSNAVLTIAPEATLVLLAGNSRTLSGAITNAGTIQWTGGGMALPSPGVLHILPGALLEIYHPPHPANLSLTAGVLINDGVIRKLAGSGTSSFGGTTFINNGVVDAQTGTISLNGITLGDGSSYLGAGTNTLVDTVTVAGAFTSENLRGGGSAVWIQGDGTLHGSAQFAVNLIITAGAALTVASNATLTCHSTLALTGSLTNAGTLINRFGIFSGTLHNLEGGLVDCVGDGSFTASGSPQFINDGLFRKSGGTGTNAIRTGLTFINCGTVLAETGTVSFADGLTNPGGTLAVAGGRILSETSLMLPGGRITGSGIIEAPAITSAAVLSPGSTDAVLVLSGNYTQLLGGVLEFDIGGNEPGVTQSQVIVTETAHLNGTLGVRWSDGHSPGVGTSHTVLQAASLTGNCTCFDGLLLLREDKRLEVSRTSINLVLTTVAAPDPTGPFLSIATEGRSLICWPPEFEGYGLYFSTNLNTGSWSLIPNATNPHWDVSLDPQKFFQLIKNP
jgi:hypothetical protein